MYKAHRQNQIRGTPSTSCVRMKFKIILINCRNELKLIKQHCVQNCGKLKLFAQNEEQQTTRLVDYKVSRTLNYGVDTKQTNIILGRINRSVIHVGYRKQQCHFQCQERSLSWIIMSVGMPWLKKAVDKLERGQKQAPSMISGLKNLTHEERLKWFVQSRKWKISGRQNSL